MSRDGKGFAITVTRDIKAGTRIACTDRADYEEARGRELLKSAARRRHMAPTWRSVQKPHPVRNHWIRAGGAKLKNFAAWQSLDPSYQSEASGSAVRCPKPIRLLSVCPVAGAHVSSFESRPSP